MCFWTLRLTWTRQRWIFVVGQVVVMALSAPFSVGGHDQGWLELVEEAGVIVGVFFRTPAPGDDVVEGAGHEEAFGVEEGAINEELIVDAVAVGVAGYL